MPMSERIPVRSSNIDSIAYDDEARILEVEFKNGGRYQYTGVPPFLVEEMQAAGSPGAFFHTRIRNVFPHTKL